MTKTFIVAILMSAALAACGSKAKKATTPDNKGGTSTDIKSSGSSTGGQTYGGAMTPTKGTGGGDPCAGGK